MDIDIHSQYKNNMSFLQQHWPAFYQKVNDADTSSLGIHTSSVGINVDVKGKMIYPDNINHAISNQVDIFLQKPTAIYQKPYHHIEGPGMSIHSKILKDILKQSTFNNEGWKDYGQNPNLTTFPFMVMAGIGGGQHIEELINKSDIKHIIIADKNYSLLHASMYIVDWVKIILSFNRPGYKINFFIGEEAKTIAYSILNEIFDETPYKSFYIPYYTHYEDEFFDDIKKHFLDKVQLTFQGLGFIDDNLNSLNKTRENLKHNIPVYTGGINIPEDSTLFIVASGPSLDNDIEYIKKFKDNAVIFSCGTALRVLEINGIVPDFHFEIEREEEIHDVLTTHTSKEFRDKVSLIGLNVLYDKVFTDDFKESYLYFRASDAGSSIVPDNLPKLFNTNPTVTNGAVSFACEFKWDKIYLFGADMGFKDMKNHHSKDAFHYIGDEDGKQWHKAHPGREITNTIESNFDNGKIYTTSVFFWSKQRIENTLMSTVTVIHNCSDGAKIDNSIPFHADQINIQTTHKLNTVNIIKSNFKDLETNKLKFSKNYKKQLIQHAQLISKIQKEIKNKEIDTFADIFYILDKSFLLFRPKDKPAYYKAFHTKSLSTNLLRGTVASVYAIIYSHSMAMYDLKEATTFAKKAFNTLADALENLKKLIYKE